MPLPLLSFLFFFFNDTATTEIYTLSLHDALPIFPVSDVCVCRRMSPRRRGTFSAVRCSFMRAATVFPLPAGPESRHSRSRAVRKVRTVPRASNRTTVGGVTRRSEEHTSELQSPDHLV